MLNEMCKQVFLLCLVANIFYCTSAFASASVEEQSYSVGKKYKSGNSIELTCQKKSDDCVVLSIMYGVKRRLLVSFSDYRVRPDLRQVSLYVQSPDGSEYSFGVSVICEDDDMALVPEEIGIAECMASFRVVNGRIEDRPRVQIFPVTTQTLYRRNQ